MKRQIKGSCCFTASHLQAGHTKEKGKKETKLPLLPKQTTAWWHLGILTKDKQEVTDCSNVLLLHIIIWFSAFKKPAMQNCRTLSAYWCTARPVIHPPPLFKMHTPYGNQNLMQQTDQCEERVTGGYIKQWLMACNQSSPMTWFWGLYSIA